MQDVQTNTMNITLEEYKSFTDEVSKAKEIVSSKNETISTLTNQISLLEDKLQTTIFEKEDAKNYLYVTKLNPWMNGTVKLLKNDPAIVEVIEKSYEKKAKDIQDKLDTANERLAQISKNGDRDLRELKDVKNEEIKKLNKQIDDLKKDYEDLKLDKAANIVESERLEEINKLKQQLAEKDVSESYSFENFRSELPWYLKPFANKMYHYALSIQNSMQCRKQYSTINTTSAFGKAKDYLKTLANNVEQPNRVYFW